MVKQSNNSLIEQNRQIEIVTQQIIRARIYYDIWWFYKGHETRPDVVEVMEDYSEFLRFDEHAHFVSMIVHSCCIWDKGSKVVSLLQLGRSLLDTKRLTSDKVLWESFESCADQFAGLKTIRDKAIAHRSQSLDYDKAFKVAGIIPDSIKLMLMESLRLVNILRVKAGMDEAEFASYPLHHIMGLVSKLGGTDFRPRTAFDEAFGE